MLSSHQGASAAVWRQDRGEGASHISRYYESFANDLVDHLPQVDRGMQLPRGFPGNS
jgi:DNA helicase HerA-like ATPase